MAPNPLNCSVPDCDYLTPQGCPNWEQMIKLLEVHQASVHPQPGGAQAGANGPPNTKLESIPRPKFKSNMTESQWLFTRMQWDEYINQIPNTSPGQKLQQLRAACEQDLLQ